MYCVLKQVRFATKEEPFERGSQITEEDFIKELPEPGKRSRIITSLIEHRRIVEISEITNGKAQKLVDSGEVKAANLEDLSYKELQKIAKEQGLRSVGVSKEELIEKLKE